LSKKNLEYWINLAKLLEEGKYNAPFLADNLGSHDVYKGSHAPAIESEAQWSLYDPFMVRKDLRSNRRMRVSHSRTDNFSNGSGVEESCVRDYSLYHI
jgi:hypothetical protein